MSKICFFSDLVMKLVEDVTYIKRTVENIDSRVGRLEKAINSYQKSGNSHGPTNTPELLTVESKAKTVAEFKGFDAALTTEMTGKLVCFC